MGNNYITGGNENVFIYTTMGMGWETVIRMGGN